MLDEYKFKARLAEMFKDQPEMLEHLDDPIVEPRDYVGIPSRLSSISDRSLRQHLKRYEEDIRMQMDILDPDIILCCSGVVFDTVMSVCFNDEYETNDPRLSWIHYLTGERKRVVVNSYHPAYCGISESFFYNEMMKDYHGFLMRHPEYQSFR